MQHVRGQEEPGDLGRDRRLRQCQGICQNLYNLQHATSHGQHHCMAIVELIEAAARVSVVCDALISHGKEQGSAKGFFSQGISQYSLPTG